MDDCGGAVDRGSGTAKSGCCAEKARDDVFVLLGLARAGAVDQTAAGRDERARRGRANRAALRPGLRSRRAGAATGCPGSRRTVPRPEHGASTSTRSKALSTEGQRAGSGVVNDAHVLAPVRASVAASSRTRRGRTSVASPAPCADLCRKRQGLSARRRARVEHAIPVTRGTSSATICEASSWTTASPAERPLTTGRARRATRSPCGAIAVGSVARPSATSCAASASRSHRKPIGGKRQRRPADC